VDAQVKKLKNLLAEIDKTYTVYSKEIIERNAEKAELARLSEYYKEKEKEEHEVPDVPPPPPIVPESIPAQQTTPQVAASQNSADVQKEALELYAAGISKEFIAKKTGLSITEVELMVFMSRVQ
jgi:hypothetical protein